MSIETMPAVLTWTAGTAMVQEVHEQFASHVTSAMWEAVERIRCWNRQLAARLDRAMGEAGQDELERVLLAPETTNRLLRQGSVDDAEVGRFVCRSFLAEAARTGRLVQSDDVVWTALGDGRLLPTGEFVAGPSIPRFVPLDFESPGPDAPAGSGAPSGPVDRRELDQGERLVALERLTVARDLIRKASDAADTFVSRFTRVLVVRRGDPAAWSSAAASHIGRSVLLDPHAPDVDEVDLTEAVVRDAVHAFVRTQELLEPWTIGPALSQSAPPVLSPWTGRPLSPRAFLRDCFVRYGLLNFWCMVLGVGASDPDRIRQRIAETVRGFAVAPVLDVVTPHAGGMTEGVRSAVGEIQRVVHDCFDAVVA